jgi:hypothetical protein
MRKAGALLPLLRQQGRTEEETPGCYHDMQKVLRVAGEGSLARAFHQDDEPAFAKKSATGKLRMASKLIDGLACFETQPQPKEICTCQPLYKHAFTE